MPIVVFTTSTSWKISFGHFHETAIRPGEVVFGRENFHIDNRLDLLDDMMFMNVSFNLLMHYLVDFGFNNFMGDS